MLTLVLGGARSGKSTYAEQLAAAQGDHVLYVATASPLDDEMAQRIEAHRVQRPFHWETLECTTAVGPAINNQTQSFDVILIDCLTLLASNVISQLPEERVVAEAEDALAEEINGIIAAYQQSTANWIIVSNEVGLGLVPPYPLGRIYRDALGRANQKLAQLADSVLFMVAGLPMQVK